MRNEGERLMGRVFCCSIAFSFPHEIVNYPFIILLPMYVFSVAETGLVGGGDSLGVNSFYFLLFVFFGLLFLVAGLLFVCMIVTCDIHSMFLFHSFCLLVSEHFIFRAPTSQLYLLGG